MDSVADLYSFTDVSRDSGAPYFIKLDLRSKLAQFRQKLNSGGYTSDYEFQSDLMNTMNLLFDAHTIYRAPEGYRCFFNRPFSLEAVYNDSKLSYTLRLGVLGSGAYPLWVSNFGINPADYLNQEVVLINGKPVTDHVIGVAQNFIALYKDEAVRFNAALRGRWSATLFAMAPITDPNFDYDSTYVLADGRSVTIPNAAYCPIGPKSTDHILQQNLWVNRWAPGTNSSKRASIPFSGLDVHQEHDEIFQKAIAALPVPMKRLNARDTLYDEEIEETNQIHTINIHDYSGVHAAVGSEFHDVSGFEVPIRQIYANYDVENLRIVTSVNNDTFFLKYRDGINPPIWIFKLLSFLPKDQAASVNVLNTLITDAAASQGTHLIVDVAYNGGGSICLSDLILALLVPEWRTLRTPHPNGTPFGIYDYKLSKSAIAMRSSATANDEFTMFEQYLHIGSEKPFTREFYEPIPRTHAGATSNYTQQALFPAQCIDIDITKIPPVSYYFKSITVLTDGTCGSACALFASQLQSNKKATVVSYGGILGRTIPLSTASFAGGSVIEYEQISGYSISDPNPDLPPMLTSSATTRLNFNEFYEHNDLVTPREFLKRPAQYHIDFYATLYSSNPWRRRGLASYAALYNAVAHTF